MGVLFGPWTWDCREKIALQRTFLFWFMRIGRFDKKFFVAVAFRRYVLGNRWLWKIFREEIYTCEEFYDESALNSFFEIENRSVESLTPLSSILSFIWSKNVEQWQKEFFRMSSLSNKRWVHRDSFNSFKRKHLFIIKRHLKKQATYISALSLN